MVAWDPDRFHVAAGLVTQVVPWFLHNWLQTIDRPTLTRRVAQQRAEDWQCKLRRRLRDRHLLNGTLDAAIQVRFAEMAQRDDDPVREQVRVIEERLKAMPS